MSATGKGGTTDFDGLFRIEVPSSGSTTSFITWIHN